MIDIFGENKLVLSFSLYLEYISAGIMLPNSPAGEDLSLCKSIQNMKNHLRKVEHENAQLHKKLSIYSDECHRLALERSKFQNLYKIENEKYNLKCLEIGEYRKCLAKNKAKEESNWETWQHNQKIQRQNTAIKAELDKKIVENDQLLQEIQQLRRILAEEIKIQKNTLAKQNKKLLEKQQGLREELETLQKQVERLKMALGKKEQEKNSLKYDLYKYGEKYNNLLRKQYELQQEYKYSLQALMTEIEKRI